MIHHNSGKSIAGDQLGAAYLLGRNHPDVVRWCARNGIDPATIPVGPTRVCFSSLTSNESKRIQRPGVKQYLPPGCRWSNETGDGEAQVVTPNGSVGIFKSNDQGARAYQADRWHLLVMDEEHDEPVYNEATMRLVDYRGRALLTMTPLLGLTWVHRRFIESPDPGSAIYWLHGTDNPHVDQEWLSLQLAKYGPHERAARERGEFTAMEGRVYSDFARSVHVVPCAGIPAEWPRHMTIDPGTRNPCAILLCALDPSDDTLHVLAESYERERTVSDHAVTIRRMLTGHPEPEVILCDPEDRGFRLSLAAEHDIQTTAANKEIRAGISAVADRLRLDARGVAHLYIDPSCRNLIRELEGYVWAPQVGRSDAKDAPLKRDDHAVDALRYLCRYLARSAGPFAM